MGGCAAARLRVSGCLLSTATISESPDDEESALTEVTAAPFSMSTPDCSESTNEHVRLINRRDPECSTLAMEYELLSCS